MRNFSKTIYAYIFLLVVTIILISTVGLKILLNSSVFIADFFNKKQPESFSKTNDVYGTLNVDNIPVATNSPKFIVSGSVVNYDKVQFFIGGKKVDEIKSVSTDSFSKEIGDLKEGENQVYLKALTNDLKSSKKSDIFTIIFKPNKPKLEISEPQDKSKTSNQEIYLKGTTDKEVFIKINDLPVTVDINGNFQTSIRLKDGDNTITVVATDIANNVETKTLTVTYQKED